MGEYKGIVFAVDDEHQDLSIDKIYFAESQLEEYQRYIERGELPDGRKVIKSRIFENPVGRREVMMETLIMETLDLSSKLVLRISYE